MRFFLQVAFAKMMFSMRPINRFGMFEEFSYILQFRNLEIKRLSYNEIYVAYDAKTIKIVGVTSRTSYV